MSEQPNKATALASIAGLNNQVLPKDFADSTGQGTPAFEAPSSLTANNSLDEILAFARKGQVSDVHLAPNCPIILRQFGALKPHSKDAIPQAKIEEHIKGLLKPDQLSEFTELGDLELVHTIEGYGRFRITVARHRFGWDLTARVITQTLPSFADSGMPESCKKLTSWATGMILVTGPAGCGKTTSLCTLVEEINKQRAEHIISIENPIEYVFTPDKCQITQREVNRHTLSQANALRAALREDPDILIVSELRDLESIELAVTAAETGHLVFATLNTNDAAQTISRLVDSFPPENQSIIRNMVSETLRGVISQQLVPKMDGSGLIPAYEVLVVNTAISNMIRENNLTQVVNTMTTGKAQGMVILDNVLLELVEKGVIDPHEAYHRAIDPKRFGKYLKKAEPAENTSG